ncbi:MAG: hypothetical protein WCD18_02415, partial [Thermosynechococcaceae cyanobacterium]
YAQQFNPTHWMMMDADDCVNCHLAQLVDNNPECDGWVMRKGYMYQEGSRFIFINVTRFNHVSGTSVIIKNGLENLLFKTNPDLYLPSFETLPGADIKSLPFMGAIYSMLNGENILMSSQTYSQMKGQILTSIPRLFQRLLRYRVWILTPSIIRDFGLYPVATSE